MLHHTKAFIVLLPEEIESLCSYLLVCVLSVCVGFLSEVNPFYEIKAGSGNKRHTFYTFCVMLKGAAVYLSSDYVAFVTDISQPLLLLKGLIVSV